MPVRFDKDDYCASKSFVAPRSSGVVGIKLGGSFVKCGSDKMN